MIEFQGSFVFLHFDSFRKMHLLGEIFSSLPYIPIQLRSPDFANLKKQLSVNNNDSDREEKVWVGVIAFVIDASDH